MDAKTYQIQFRVNDDDRQKLEALRKELAEQTGLEVSISSLIRWLIQREAVRQEV